MGMGRRAAHHARRAQALPWWVGRLQIQSWSGQVAALDPSQPFPTHIHTPTPPTPPTWARIWVSPATSTLLTANGPSASNVCTPPATCTPGARAPPCALCWELLALAARSAASAALPRGTSSPRLACRQYSRAAAAPQAPARPLAWRSSACGTWTSTAAPGGSGSPSPVVSPCIVTTAAQTAAHRPCRRHPRRPRWRWRRAALQLS